MKMWSCEWEIAQGGLEGKVDRNGIGVKMGTVTPLNYLGEFFL